MSGALSCVAAREDAPRWSEEGAAAYIARLQRLLRAGGHAIGAFDDRRLVGFASLGAQGVGGDPTVLQLDMLYVSRESRGLGIGRDLTRRIGDVARTRGATALYVSATPTRGTVDAYLRLGAELSAAPDPTLFDREPEDIHLVLRLR